MEIHNDLCLSNVIASCLDYEYSESLYERVNMFIKIILKQKVSPHYTSMLMGLFDQIQGLETPLPSYAQFFNSAFQED